MLSITKNRDLRSWCGREKKNKNTKTLINNILAFLKCTRSRYTTYIIPSNQKNINYLLLIFYKYLQLCHLCLF